MTKRPQKVRDVTRLAVLFSMISMTLAGCGFQPLYAVSETGESASSQLAQVEIRPIKEPWQVIANERKFVSHRYDSYADLKLYTCSGILLDFR